MRAVDSAFVPDGSNTLVIFGASGDLTRRKLVPALCSLYCKGSLPGNLGILGVARSELNDEQYRAMLRDSLDEEIARPTPEQWADFSSRVHYLHGDITSADDLLCRSGASCRPWRRVTGPPTACIIFPWPRRFTSRP